MSHASIPGAAPTPESPAAMLLRYAKETRGAVIFIAWIAGIFAALAIIGGIYGYVQIVHIENAVTQVSSGTNTGCASLGGNDPSC